MKIYKEIFRLAGPNILSNISVPLMSSVDTGLMGHLSAGHLAAVGSAAMIFNFLYWNFGFLRMGTTGMVAQAYGKDDLRQQSRILFQAILVALIISILLLTLQLPLHSAAMKLMNLDGNLQELASEYYFTRIWDAPATLLMYIMMAWFFGHQNARIPLMLTIVINVCNLLCSLYFVRVLDMEISGVALGTVISNYLGLTLAIIFLLRYYPVRSISRQELFSDLQRFWRINRDIFIRTLMLSLSFAFLYSQAANFGPIMLATTVIILQFTNWMSYAIDGFAYAAEAIVGRYKGAEDHVNAMSAITANMWAGLALGVVFSLVYFLYPLKIASWFTESSEVIAQIDTYKYFLAILPLVGFASYIWDGIFVGLTASKAMRNTMFVSFICFLASYYLTVDKLGYEALLWALSVYLFSRGIAQTVVFYRKKLDLT